MTWKNSIPVSRRFTVRVKKKNWKATRAAARSSLPLSRSAPWESACKSNKFKFHSLNFEINFLKFLKEEAGAKAPILTCDRFFYPQHAYVSSRRSVSPRRGEMLRSFENSRLFACTSPCALICWEGNSDGSAVSVLPHVARGILWVLEYFIYRTARAYARGSQVYAQTLNTARFFNGILTRGFLAKTFGIKVWKIRSRMSSVEQIIEEHELFYFSLFFRLKILLWSRPKMRLSGPSSRNDENVTHLARVIISIKF